MFARGVVRFRPIHNTDLRKDGWRFNEMGETLNRVSPVRARLRRVALREVLGRYKPWEYAVDQSYQMGHAVRGPATAIHLYASVLASLPCGWGPVTAWCVAEKHPRSVMRLWHVHGLWCGCCGPRWPGWRAVKEYLGERWGWARFHRMPGGNADLAARLVYPTDHATKQSPTTFARRMAIMGREVIRPGHRLVRYAWRGSWWGAAWQDGVGTPSTREV